MKKILAILKNIGLGTIFVLIVSWCVWTSSNIYRAQALENQVEIRNNINSKRFDDLENTLQNISDKIDKKIDKLRDKMDEHQEKILDILSNLNH